MNSFTHNRAICEGDTGSIQRPSKDKTVIWRTCREMSSEELNAASRAHPSLSWRSVAEQIIRERCEDAHEQEMAVLGDSAPFIKETTKIVPPTSRRAKKHRSVWKRQWSSVRH